MAFITGDIVPYGLFYYCPYYEINQIRIAAAITQGTFQIDLFV
jgi:hypothetical protein